MIIIWGRKVRKSWCGRFLDYCPICRQARVFDLDEVRSVPHIYYIPVGSGRTEAWVQKCRTCRLDYTTDDIRVLESAVRDRHADERLLAEADKSPVAGKIANRLEIDRQMRDKSFTAEQRLNVLREPFAIAVSRLEGRKQSIQFDAQSGLLLAAVILLALGLLGYTFQSAQSFGFIPENLRAPALLAALCLLAAVPIVSLATDGARYTRRELVPMLVRALHPISPSVGEIEQIVHELKDGKVALGKHLDARQLHEAIETHIPLD